MKKFKLKGKAKGAASNLQDKTAIQKHREWRGPQDNSLQDRVS